MSTVYQSNLASRNGRLGSAGLADPSLYNATIRYAQATIVLPSAVAATNILELVELPQGAQVIPSMCQAICHADPGDALVLNVGVAGSASLFASALNLNAGGVVSFTAAGVPVQSTARTKLATETMVRATVTTATNITNNSTITFMIAYLVG
jgi:hypothetical protein